MQIVIPTRRVVEISEIRKNHTPVSRTRARTMFNCSMFNVYCNTLRKHGLARSPGTQMLLAVFFSILGLGNTQQEHSVLEMYLQKDTRERTCANTSDESSTQ